MEGSMSMSRSFVLAMALVCLAMALATVCAQNSPQDYLYAHNVARAAVGVQPLTWDTTVEAYARNYANQRIGDCNLIHSINRPYGENIFAGRRSGLTTVDAVNSWVEERQWYNYPTNTCASGRVCGHYTQVVWRNSVALGCARVNCNNGGTFIICSYSPPGNWNNQRPY